MDQPSTEQVDAQVTNIELPEDTSTEQNTPQYTETQLKAMEAGWKPKEEFTGDPEKWVEASEFIRRGELFDKIDTLGRELKDTKRVLAMLKQHHEQVRETEYKRALEELKMAKKEAYETGDVDRIMELDEKISDFKAEAKAQKAAESAQPSQPDPRFVTWVQKNPWYAQDPELRAFADEVGVAYSKTKNASPEEVLEYTVNRVKKAFPEKFTNPNRAKPSAVEGASAPKVSKKDSFELTETEQKAMKAFVRQGVMTQDEYIAEIKRMRGVK